MSRLSARLLRSLGASTVAVCRKRWAATRLVCWTARSLIIYKQIKSLRLNHKALKEKLLEVHAEYIDVTESRTSWCAAGFTPHPNAR
jgi:hypothetical protein